MQPVLVITEPFPKTCLRMEEVVHNTAGRLRRSLTKQNLAINPTRTDKSLVQPLGMVRGHHYHLPRPLPVLEKARASCRYGCYVLIFRCIFWFLNATWPSKESLLLIFEIKCLSFDLGLIKISIEYFYILLTSEPYFRTHCMLDLIQTIHFFNS